MVIFHSFLCVYQAGYHFPMEFSESREGFGDSQKQGGRRAGAHGLCEGAEDDEKMYHIKIVGDPYRICSW